MPLDVTPVSDGFAALRRHDDDIVTLSVRGAIDEVTAPSLATQLDESMTFQPRLLIVDLTAVRFMSTSGINLLVEMHRLTASTPTALRVVADGAATGRPMRLLGLERVVELYANVEDARTGRPPRAHRGQQATRPVAEATGTSRMFQAKTGYASRHESRSHES